MMWESEGLALADSYDDSTGRYGALASYAGGSVATLPDTALVVQLEVAAAQQEGDRVVGPDPTGGKAGPGDDGVTGAKPETGGPTGGTTVVEPAPVLNRRFFGVVKVNPERYARDFSRIAQEVLQHLAAVDDTDLEVTVEISAANEAGFPADKVRVVTENAATLRFDQHGFEAS